MKSALVAVAMLVASVAAQTGDPCVDQCVVRFQSCCETADPKDPDCMFFSDCKVTTLTGEVFCQIGSLRGCDGFCFDGRLVIDDSGTLACGKPPA